MAYQYIIFDFDGTIVDSVSVQNEILKELAMKHHFNNMDVKAFRRRDSLTFRKKAQMLSFVIQIQAEYKSLYNELLFKVKPFEGLLSLLSSLQASGYDLAIISSNAAENIAKFLHLNDAALDIPIISSKGLSGKHKALTEFTRRYHCHSSDILYIGDEIRDIKACNKSKVDIAFVRWGLDADKDLTSYNIKFVASSVLELRQFLIPEP
ncbi:MAG: HAD-superfamily hydrolase, subfamily variant 1 [Oscillospiraceae bacterium]|nr:HAD-superfamily hydrolase, subfamily variant 1 [Oscillospiraceae bacterium]